jgi:hypothetical protein
VAGLPKNMGRGGKKISKCRYELTTGHDRKHPLSKDFADA